MFDTYYIENDCIAIFVTGLRSKQHKWFLSVLYPALFSAQPDVLLRGHTHVPRLLQWHKLSAAAGEEGPQYGVCGIPVPFLEPQRPAPVQLLGRWNAGIGSKRWKSHSAH